MSKSPLLLCNVLCIQVRPRNNCTLVSTYVFLGIFGCNYVVRVYKAHPRLLIFPAVKKSAPYTRDYTVHLYMYQNKRILLGLHVYYYGKLPKMKAKHARVNQSL